MGVITALKEFKGSKAEVLKENGFQVSREFKVSCEAFPQGEFLVDDVGKRFAIWYIEAIKTKNPFTPYKHSPKFWVVNYSDLGAFELIEDGTVVSQGKGVATAVGALTFGLLGALVGASGKRKSQNICTSMGVRILLNDLQNPQMEIVLISSDIRKDNPYYKEKMKLAQELMAVLNYISNNS